MGEYVWIPSQGLLSDEDNRAAGMRNTTNKETNREEGSGDPEEDAIPYFIHDSNMVGGSNIANSNSNPSSTKRKGSHNTTPQCRKIIGELEWEHNYLYVWINLLSLSP
jgi:hypothetical protein